MCLAASLLIASILPAQAASAEAAPAEVAPGEVTPIETAHSQSAPAQIAAGAETEWLTPVTLYGGIDVGSHLVVNTWPLFDPDTATATGESSAMFALKVGGTLRQAPWLRGDFGLAVIPYQSTRGEDNTALLYSFDVVYVARGLTSTLADIDWTPVAGGGVGLYHNVRGALGHDADMAVHLGMGLRGRINERYRIRLSVRDYFSDYIDGQGPGNNLELSVGIELLLFGNDTDEAVATAAADAAAAASEAPEVYPAKVETVPAETPMPIADEPAPAAKDEPAAPEAATPN